MPSRRLVRVARQPTIRERRWRQIANDRDSRLRTLYTFVRRVALTAESRLQKEACKGPEAPMIQADCCRSQRDYLEG
jgi:hypothetical protein